MNKINIKSILQFLFLLQIIFIIGYIARSKQLPNLGKNEAKNISLCTELNISSDIYNLKFYNLNYVADSNNNWITGQTIKIKFLGGTDKMILEVKKRIMLYKDYCNLNYVFVDKETADIRISFITGGGHFSIVGAASRGWSHNWTTKMNEKSGTGTTINFDWPENYYDSLVYDRVVLHEFGHAMGMQHEHQSPASNLVFNSSIYKYYKEKHNWDSLMVVSNIIKKYNTSSTKFSQYDPNSIMIYAIPPEILEDVKQSTHWNHKLSELDIYWLQMTYPY